MIICFFAFEKSGVDFKLLSLNVRGIRSPTKRKALFCWLGERKYDIVFLQETYSTIDIESVWRTQWQGKLYFSHGSNHSCGVMILVRDDLDFKLNFVRSDDNGRYIIMEAEVQGSSFLFVNIYAPNSVQDQFCFYDNLNKNIEENIIEKDNRIILGGDFNVTLNPVWDCSGGNQSKKASAKFIEDLCLDFDLIDIWRIRNPEIKRFTWGQKKPLIQRRLDFWLISDVCQEDIEKSDIISSINSDHSAIILHFSSIGEQKYGPSFWKFNASLADDMNYVSLLTESIPAWLAEFNAVTDKRVLWDLIKYRIRQFSIKYSKGKAREKRERVSKIEKMLQTCEEQCSKCPSDENFEQLENLKIEYDDLYEDLAKGAIIRSKATWYEKGERSNKYFLNLESHNKSKSSVRKIFNGEGVLITDPQKVQQEIERFYSDLCKSDTLSPSENMLNSFLKNPDVPKLSQVDVQVCEGKLTVSECFKSLQLFQNNKSPGNDGLTVEFYKAFSNVLGEFMVNSLNDSYDRGELSNSQKEAIITLIEKKDKDKRYLSNWRPISLINVDVKIGSKAIAKRLESVLPNIIHYNQCAYVKGRTICDAIRTVEDIMEFTERYCINGKMICIDFKKAFDTVSRNFLFKTLQAFGFGYSFIQWIHTFYKNISSCVLNNGFSTAPFSVERGVRQGDPLPAYLFIIVLETLCICIRRSKDIQGITVDTEEIKLGLFADDLTGFLKNDISLQKFLELVEAFGECSGLRINHDKSEVMLLGNSVRSSLRNDTEIKNLEIKHSVKILGVHFTYDSRAKRKLNFDEIVTSIKQKLHIWRWRDLTIFGRIQIVKTFIIPIFLYRASMVCCDQEFVKEVNKIIFDFIWKGKDKVKRSVLVGDIEDGGLKAPHLNSMIETQRIMCCKKLVSDEPSSWKIILLHYLKPVGGKFILCGNFDVKRLPIKVPPFYEDCLKSFVKCSVANNQCEEITDDINEILQIVLWNNKHIRIDGKPVFYKTLAEKGILRIGDLISENNELITKCSLRELNLTPLDQFRLISVLNALPSQWRDSLNGPSCSVKKAFNLEEQIVLRLNGQNTSISKAVSKTIYKELRNRVITVPSAQEKCRSSFINDTLDWPEIYSLPHRVTSDTKMREFQFKLLNKYLVTNVFLYKIGVVSSPVCSFCGKENESLEHILINCNYTKEFWAEVIKWLRSLKVNINNLNNKEIMLGMPNCEDELFVNHVLLIAKQYLYSCRWRKTFPIFKVFTSRLRKIQNLELAIAESKNKLSLHTVKWAKFDS